MNNVSELHKFAKLLILRLQNCDMFGQVSEQRKRGKENVIKPAYAYQRAQLADYVPNQEERK